MDICPRCRGRATKLQNLNTGNMTCQQCQYVYDPETGEGVPPVRSLVILSGGQDSTTVLFHVLHNLSEVGRDHKVYCLTFDYRQRHAIEVLAACRVVEIARQHYPDVEIEHEVLVLPETILRGSSPLVSPSAELEQYSHWKTLPGGIEKTFVPLRNQLFLTLAANRAVACGYDQVFIGVSQEDFGGYPDCRDQFLSSIAQAINDGLEKVGLVRIVAPLLYKTKAETVKIAAAIRGCFEALAFSHTAYDGEYPPTGKDHATLLRAKGFEEAGFPDPLVLRAWREGRMPLPSTANYATLANDSSNKRV